MGGGVRRGAAEVVLALAASLVVCPLACGGPTFHAAADAAAGDDATASGDAASDAGTLCPLPQAFCPGTGCVAQCAVDCHGGSACVACGSVTSVVCGVRTQNGGVTCPPPPTGASPCGCANGVENCPDPAQVCVTGGLCFTCGQPGTGGLQCRKGGSCDVMTGTCI